MPIREIVAHGNPGRIDTDAGVVFGHAIDQFLFGLPLTASKCDLADASLVGDRIAADVELQAPRIFAAPLHMPAHDLLSSALRGLFATSVKNRPLKDSTSS